MQPPNRILIVDDHPTNVLGLEELLEDDYRVASAQSGEEALRIASEFCPDLILLDIMMPGIDGYETCRRLRELPQLHHTKIMMVTAKAMATERLQGYEAGADDYVTKPFDNDELRAKIRVYLKLKSIEEVDHLKSDVLKLLQHETRTPLNGIIGPAQMIRDDAEMDVEERTTMLDMVLASAERLNTLLDRVVTLSAMKSGAFAWHPVPADLGEVVHSVVGRVADYAEARQVEIEQQLCDHPPVLLDTEQVETALRALLENAIRFSPRGGSVVMGIDPHHEHVCIRVTDHGEGITPAFLPRLFDEFSSLNISQHTEGQGLSLAIARQVALAHGGTLAVESLPGMTTTFTMTLPFNHVQLPDARLNQIVDFAPSQ